MSIKERVIEYLEYKGLNRNNFYIATGFANGYLDNGTDIVSGKLAIILDLYPDINLEWLITGKGDKIITESDVQRGITKRMQKLISYIYKEQLANNEEDIAERVGLDVLMIREIARQKANITLDIIARITKAYNVNLNYIFFDRNPVFEDIKAYKLEPKVSYVNDYELSNNECKLCKSKDQTIKALNDVIELLKK